MNAPEPMQPGVQTIRVARIARPLDNPRKHFDETAQAELVESVRRHGIIQPILVRPLPDTREAFDREHYLYELAARLGVDAAEIKRELKAEEKAKKRAKAAKATKAAAPKKPTSKKPAAKKPTAKKAAAKKPSAKKPASKSAEPAAETDSTWPFPTSPQ